MAFTCMSYSVTMHTYDSLISHTYHAFTHLVMAFTCMSYSALSHTYDSLISHTYHAFTHLDMMHSHVWGWHSHVCLLPSQCTHMTHSSVSHITHSHIWWWHSDVCLIHIDALFRHKAHIWLIHILSHMPFLNHVIMHIGDHFWSSFWFSNKQHYFSHKAHVWLIWILSRMIMWLYEAFIFEIASRRTRA